MSITIVGLGPGDGRLLTREAWDVLSHAEELWVRTTRHPAVDDLPDSVVIQSFDGLYEEAESFGDVYATIVTRLLEMAAERPIIYAVPGHPHVGEATVLNLCEQAKAAGVSVRVVAGVSFFEPMVTAVGVDGMDGVQIFDALEVAEQDYPQLSPDRPVILGQVYNRMIASELKLTLMAMYPDEHPVMLVHGAGNPDEQAETLHLYEIDHSEATSHLTSLYIPPLPQRSDLASLAEAIATLRGPDGCPWDQKQTPQSMRDGFLEEVCEVLDALDRDDVDGVCEELGDVLLHITMQAQMAAEVGDFTLSDVIAGIYAKIIRRHPHVWGDVDAADSEAVVVNWEAIKKAEKAGQPEPEESVLNNIPVALPALVRSQKIQKRVRKAGFDWDDIQGVYDKLQEEVAELQAAETPEERSAELGDILFVVVNLAKWLGIDAEIALREANLRFSGRFREVERLARERDLILTEQTEKMLLDLWVEAKANVGN